jgi:hypothetical protein
MAQGATIQRVYGDGPLQHLISKRQNCNYPNYSDCYCNCCSQVSHLGEWGPFVCRAANRGRC